MSSKEKTLKYIIDMMYCVVGTFLIALAVNLFLLPCKITTGGASGVGTIVYYLFNIDVSTTILVINIPLYILAFNKMGKEFTIKSIFATFLYTFFLKLTEKIYILESLDIDLIIACIFGGMLTGIGIALAFKAEASTRTEQIC